MSTELKDKISSTIVNVLKSEIPKLAPQKIELNVQFEIKLIEMIKKVLLQETPKFAESVQKSMQPLLTKFIAKTMRTETI